MPLGNGDVGMNLWVNERGQLWFYISKSDAWSDAGQLVKVGKFRLELRTSDGKEALLGAGLEWMLDLEKAEIRIRTANACLQIWVDANAPVIRFHIEGSNLTAVLTPEPRDVPRTEKFYAGMKVLPPWALPLPPFERVVSAEGMAWYYRNETSCWRRNLEAQGLGEFAVLNDDPLLHWTCGGRVVAPEMRWNGDALESRAPASRLDFALVIHAQTAETPEDFIRALDRVTDGIPSNGDPKARRAHDEWWSAFWRRSWIVAGGCEAAEKVTQGYVYQRFLNACAGRGRHPIKFNGSLFTGEWGVAGEVESAEYRRWGGGYWHQNTRLSYWAMLASGDFDLMRPYFDMYRRALPLARERCLRLCGHEGAFFPETMHFWGTYLDQNYFANGREADLPAYLPQNRSIRHHQSGSLEVVYLAAQYYKYTNDSSFARETLIPLAEAVLDYYDLHYRRKNGRLHIYPAQAIEQWWECENPLPEIAGLTAVLHSLRALPAGWISGTRANQWARLESELPELPIRQDEGGRTLFAPAEKWIGPPRNVENPELYAVFPYFLHWQDPALVKIARDTFGRRTHREDVGWAQDGIQAALLGLPVEAARSVVGRLGVPSPYARFPAFWGPNADWIPDQCHSSNAVYTLQLMALQFQNDDEILFPAWPSHWSGEFCLVGPRGQKVVGVHDPSADGKN